jgi:hypothetical protein
VLGSQYVFLNGHQGSFERGLDTAMVLLVEIQSTQIFQECGYMQVMRTMHALGNGARSCMDWTSLNLPWICKDIDILPDAEAVF